MTKKQLLKDFCIVFMPFILVWLIFILTAFHISPYELFDSKGFKIAVGVYWFLILIIWSVTNEKILGGEQYEKKYIAYTNIWSEGTIVVREDDLKFPVGYDAMTGNIMYKDSLEEFLESSSIVAEGTDIVEMVEHDTAGYERFGANMKELKKYNALRRESWSKMCY